MLYTFLSTVKCKVLKNGGEHGMDTQRLYWTPSPWTPKLSHMYTIKIVRMSQSFSIIKCKALKIVNEYGISTFALDLISMTSAHLKE